MKEFYDAITFKILSQYQNIALLISEELNLTTHGISESSGQFHVTQTSNLQQVIRINSQILKNAKYLRTSATFDKKHFLVHSIATEKIIAKLDCNYSRICLGFFWGVCVFLSSFFFKKKELYHTCSAQFVKYYFEGQRLHCIFSLFITLQRFSGNRFLNIGLISLILMVIKKIRFL